MLAALYAFCLAFGFTQAAPGQVHEYSLVEGKELLMLLQAGEIRALNVKEGPEWAEFFFPDGKYIRYSRGVPPFTSRYRISGADVCVDLIPWCRRVISNKKSYFWDYSVDGRKEPVEIAPPSKK